MTCFGVGEPIYCNPVKARNQLSYSSSSCRYCTPLPLKLLLAADGGAVAGSFPGRMELMFGRFGPVSAIEELPLFSLRPHLQLHGHARTLDHDPKKPTRTSSLVQRWAFLEIAEAGHNTPAIPLPQGVCASPKRSS